jgi:hypothetical protein
VVLPAIREGGGGVVFEALAAGAVPVILDYGGPADIVHPGVGYKIPATSESAVVTGMGSALRDLEGDRELLNRLRQEGMSYARERLTWQAKAQSTTQVLNWVVGRGPKPELSPSTLALAGAWAFHGREPTDTAAVRGDGKPASAPTDGNGVAEAGL